MVVTEGHLVNELLELSLPKYLGGTHGPRGKEIGLVSMTFH